MSPVSLKSKNLANNYFRHQCCIPVRRVPMVRKSEVKQLQFSSTFSSFLQFFFILRKNNGPEAKSSKKMGKNSMSNSNKCYLNVYNKTLDFPFPINQLNQPGSDVEEKTI